MKTTPIPVKFDRQGHSCNFYAGFGPTTLQRGAKKGGVVHLATQQGSLHCILAQYPTTAGSAQFCLLCCQPEPVPGLLAVRMSQLTQRDPCRLPAWLGWTINIPYRTCHAPVHSITQPQSGNRRLGTPSSCSVQQNAMQTYLASVGRRSSSSLS